MRLSVKKESVPQAKTIPLCPVFGQCGGCQYQDISYEAELALKQDHLENFFRQSSITPSECFEKIVPSPIEYHYRSRLDMKFLRTRAGKMLMGFSPADNKYLIEVEACPIAMAAISDFLPRLKQEAIAKLTPKHRNANLVVKTGGEGRVAWGGIGRRSLKMEAADYLWTEIHGKRIFYSLDTFFQANLAILPLVIQGIKDLRIMDAHTIFYDLYGGVGLFGVCFADLVKKVILAEESVHSLKVAEYNVNFHSLKNFEILAGKVEETLASLLREESGARHVVMVDPPRMGLSPSAAEAISSAKNITQLLYLSCHPDSLMRDLRIFVKSGWQVTKIMPFDFFPRTQHIETLVLLKRGHHE